MTYEGAFLKNYKTYVEMSGRDEILLKCLHNILPEEFKRIGAGRSSLDVLGLGSGGGEVDAEMLSILQSTFPDVPISADVVESSPEMTDNFKALVAKTSSLQKIPFTWHLMMIEEYEREAKAKGDLKNFDFIHMVNMIYYVDNLADTIKFYHSLLKKNGKLMIVVTNGGDGVELLYTTYKKEIIDGMNDGHDIRDVIACLTSLGLQYEAYINSSFYDISECFDPSSQNGERLLSFMTLRDNFYQSFTPEIRADMLDLLRKHSIEKDGRVFENVTISCIIVHA